MIFEDVKSVISWYVSFTDEHHSSLGAVAINDDAGIDISIGNDFYDDVDTMCDIEKIISTTITKFEKTVLFYHAMFGFLDTTLPDGTIVKGSFKKFRNRISPLSKNEYRKSSKIKIKGEKFFRYFIRSAENALEKALIKEGYIIANNDYLEEN
ncbi:MAG: hypothetical protein EOL93_01915 [Epsilonproteobacteria bacterium]|nr:hypothetical protein [Campylobacterota bacterium]